VQSNVEWTQWGKTDPLFGIAAWPGHERSGAQAWTDEAFYELGKSDWEDFVARWERYGLDPTSCVEIGCGAGRLTMHLARTFARVEALDVSPDMIAYARERMPTPTTVGFHVTDGMSIPLERDSLTAAFSTHVFQHFDSPQDGITYLREIFRVLQNGGTMMIHLPLHQFPRNSGRVGGLLRKIYDLQQVYAMSRASRIRRRILAGRSGGFMRTISYDLDWMTEMLRRIGFTNVECSVFCVRSDGHAHPFVLARK
jgi:ubiquinone/menaquinone biosynthesis C-methylase UbiE